MGWHFLLVAIFVLGCQSVTPSESDGPAARTPSRLSSQMAESCEDTSTFYLKLCWPTTTVIKVSTSSTDYAHLDAIGAALSKWNELLTKVNGVPRFSWAVNDTTDADIIVRIDGSGTMYCGGQPAGEIVVRTLGSVDCPTASSYYGDITTVVAHELVTVLGWVDGVEQYGEAGVSDHCMSTFRTPTPGLLNTAVCYHDVQGLLQLYREGDVSLGQPAHYWGTKILTYSDVALPIQAVELGDSVAFTAAYLSVGPHAQYTDVVPAGPSTYSAYISPTARAHRSPGTAYLVGDQVGSADVTFRPTAPNGYALWEPLETEGVSAALTVTAPAPPVFKIDSIWSDSMPIRDPGVTTFFSRVVGAPGSPVSTRWIVTDSRTPTVSDTIWRAGWTTLDLMIDAGASYAIGLRVRPHWALHIGLEYSQDIPVCTGSGSALRWSGEEPGSPPPGTDAVGGCGGSGGGGDPD